MISSLRTGEWVKSNKEDLMGRRRKVLSGMSASIHSHYCHLSQAFSVLPWDCRKSCLIHHPHIRQSFTILFQTAQLDMSVQCTASACSLMLKSFSAAPQHWDSRSSAPQERIVSKFYWSFEGPTQFLLLPGSFSSRILRWSKSAHSLENLRNNSSTCP